MKRYDRSFTLLYIKNRPVREKLSYFSIGILKKCI